MNAGNGQRLTPSFRATGYVLCGGREELAKFYEEKEILEGATVNLPLEIETEMFDRGKKKLPHFEEKGGDLHPCSNP